MTTGRINQVTILTAEAARRNGLLTRGPPEGGQSSSQGRGPIAQGERSPGSGGAAARTRALSAGLNHRPIQFPHLSFPGQKSATETGRPIRASRTVTYSSQVEATFRRSQRPKAPVIR